MSEIPIEDVTIDLSPCVRRCCLDHRDVCVGCYRTISEITGWHDKSEQQKKVILQHCAERKALYETNG